MTWPTSQTEFTTKPLPLSIASERSAFLANAQSGERLIVTLHRAHSRLRGNLAQGVCDAIEQTLREQGAPAVDLNGNQDLEDFLDDAIYRASLLGNTGVAIEIEDLAAIADDDNTLHPDDGRTLVRMVCLTKQKPVQLLLPPVVRALKIFPEPIPVFQILPHGAQLSAPAVIEYGEPIEASSDDPLFDWVSDQRVTTSLLPPRIDEFVVADSESGDEGDLAGSAASIDDAWDEDIVSSLPPVVSSKSAETEEAVAADCTETALESPLASEAVEPVAAESAPEPVSLPAVITDETRQHLRDLDATFGPKPLATIERLYTSAFIPLQRAVNLGAAPGNAPAVLEQWSVEFARSYKEAFEALKQRGRRPTMIMDLPELAQRTARLHGSRNVQLLMVDGMRYDLGQKVNAQLSALLQTKAALAEQYLIWSGLPCTTATQLELLGRGPNALREFTGQINDEMVVNRGRLAHTIRRIRTGHRELLKLDLVEAKLVGPGDAPEARLDDIATQVAAVLAAHIEQQPSGTLIMIFGDHGFHFELDEHGRTSAVAAPSGRVEEVLTGASAWLAGAVH